MANDGFLSRLLRTCGPAAGGLLAAALFCSGSATAQEEPAAAAPAAAASPYRKLAPGVERLIDPERSFSELTSVHDVVELDYPWAKTAAFRHDIWSLEFSFKPVRFMRVDVPGKDGKLERKLLWYMVYRVNNPGVVYRAKGTAYAEEAESERKDKALGDAEVFWREKEFQSGEIVPDQDGAPVRFVPTFLLYSRDEGKSYLDRVIPPAPALIQRREDPARRLLNTVQITGSIPASTPDDDKAVWGVVTWEDVDPRTDFFSIYVQGLTNAYQWRDLPDGSKWYARKTLRLDFWRPGDEFIADEQAIRFLRSTWVYLDSEWRSRPPEAK